MNAKVLRCAAAVLVLMCGPALATVYTWTSENDGDWNDSGNWTCSPSCDPTDYPSTTNDDAVVAKAVTIFMSAETIDDLSIGNPGTDGGPTFDGQESVVVLNVESFSVAGGASDYTEVTMVNKGVIQTY